MTGAKSAHAIRIQAEPRRVRVRFAGHVIADSANAVTLLETGHAPVYYLPREDVNADLLEASTHTSHCPHKGDARYWSIRCPDAFSRDAAWSYDDPLPAVAAIRRHLAFYPGRVDAITAEE